MNNPYNNKNSNGKTINDNDSGNNNITSLLIVNNGFSQHASCLLFNVSFH